MTHRLLALSLTLSLLTGLARLAPAGLPGYVEWVIWEETRVSQTVTRTFRWVMGPYPKRVDCEQERDRLAANAIQRSVNVVTQFLCVPDTVDPREDSRWQ
jgi:hypothetical protein